MLERPLEDLCILYRAIEIIENMSNTDIEIEYKKSYFIYQERFTPCALIAVHTIDHVIQMYHIASHMRCPHSLCCLSRHSYIDAK